MERRGGAKRQGQTDPHQKEVRRRYNFAGYDKFNSCVCSSAYLVTPNTWSRVDIVTGLQRNCR